MQRLEKDSLIVTQDCVVSLHSHFLIFSFSVLDVLNRAAEISHWNTVFEKVPDFLPTLLKVHSHVLTHTKIIVPDWR